jgi:predicted nucleic acid-binding protein
MAGLTTVIPPATIVGIDTVTFIYYLEAVPRYLHVVAPFFQAVAAGHFAAVTSVVSLMEIAVRPLRLDRPDIADTYELLLRNYPHLRVVDVDRLVARRAAELRATDRLRPADSLQVATALEAGASTFVTNDHALTSLSTIRVLLIDTFILSGAV